MSVEFTYRNGYNANFLEIVSAGKTYKYMSLMRFSILTEMFFRISKSITKSFKVNSFFIARTYGSLVMEKFFVFTKMQHFG